MRKLLYIFVTLFSTLLLTSCYRNGDLNGDLNEYMDDMRSNIRTLTITSGTTIRICSRTSSTVKSLDVMNLSTKTTDITESN